MGILPPIGIIDGPAVVVFFLLVFMGVAAMSLWRGTGLHLVIKQWYVSNVPRADGAYISIVGRRAGVVGWLLSVLGLDPTVTFSVSEKRIMLHASSLAGTSKRVSPLGTVSSSSYGFHKPWLGAVLVGLLAFALLVALSAVILPSSETFYEMRPFVVLVFSTVGGFFAAKLYYHYSQALSLGYVEVSGVAAQIRFEPSVIEGVVVDERQAEYAAQVMQHLIQVRIDR